MAPPQLYPRPNVQLLRLLQEAKAQGLSFGEAWVEAIRPGKAIVMTTTVAAPAMAIRWPTDRWDREAWRAAILGSREAWRRAYYGEPPTVAERAIVSLAEAFSVLDEVAAAVAGDEGIAGGREVASVA